MSCILNFFIFFSIKRLNACIFSIIWRTKLQLGSFCCKFHEDMKNGVRSWTHIFNKGEICKNVFYFLIKIINASHFFIIWPRNSKKSSLSCKFHEDVKNVVQSRTHIFNNWEICKNVFHFFFKLINASHFFMIWPRNSKISSLTCKFHEDVKNGVRSRTHVFYKGKICKNIFDRNILEWCQNFMSLERERGEGRGGGIVYKSIFFQHKMV